MNQTLLPPPECKIVKYSGLSSLTDLKEGKPLISLTTANTSCIRGDRDKAYSSPRLPDLGEYHRPVAKEKTYCDSRV